METLQKTTWMRYLLIGIKTMLLLFCFSCGNKQSEPYLEIYIKYFNNSGKKVNITVKDKYFDSLYIYNYQINNVEVFTQKFLFARGSIAGSIVKSDSVILNFDNSMPDCQGVGNNGLFINLHNNLWNTAFPIYYGQDSKFRFKIEF